MKRIARLKYFFFPFIFLALCSVSDLYAQCNQTPNQGASCSTRNPIFGSTVLPNAGCGNNRIYQNQNPGVYYQMPVLKGGCYLVSTCGSGIDTQLSFFEGNNTTGPFAWRDDNGPDCGGFQASMRIVPDFTDYTRFNINQYNCSQNTTASIIIKVRQNNNLNITSSNTDMCEGETRQLRATPARVTVTPKPGSGNAGTFSGTNVQDSTFTANTPVGDVDTITVTYTFGYCSTTQDIRVFKNVTPANAGPDQSIGPTNTTLAAVSPSVGTGVWGVLIGSGTFTNANDPTTTVTGLTVGLNRLVWAVFNGPCISLDTMDINVSGCNTIVINSPPGSTTAACEDTISFTVNTTGSTPITYQWQESTDGGSTWSNLSNGGLVPTYSGTDSDSLILANISYPYDQYQYRVFLDNPCSTDTSGVAILSISDTNPPTPVCPVVTPVVTLDGSGNGMLSTNQGDGSSFDGCDGSSVTETSPAINVTCMDVGTNTFTLTVQDLSGNTDTATCNFTILDTIQPICNGGPIALLEFNQILAADGVASDNFGYSVGISGDYAVVGMPKDDDVGTNSGAAYIYYRNQGGADAWGQVKKLTASDIGSGDEFGRAVAISGEQVIIAAEFNDDNGGNSGSAYIFARNQGGPDNWGQVTKILAPDGQSSDFFGHSVQISGDRCIVGATGDDDNGSSSGSAYVFARNQGGPDNWGQVKKLLASDGSGSDGFGTGVAISGDVAFVGAPTNDDVGSNSGSAYVFSKDEGGIDNWGEVVKVLPLDLDSGDFFGEAVSLSGDRALVGARFNDDNGSGSGSAYIFERNQGGADKWGEVKKLLASDAQGGDNLGFSVSISGDSAFVGSWLDHSPLSDQGSAYLFLRNEGGTDNWGEKGKITASDAGGGDRYGISVSVSGQFAIVGAYQWGGPSVNNQGAAYIISGPYDGCPDDIDLYLTASGIDSVAASTVGNCYSDNCVLTFSISDSVFACQDTGANPVLFITTDPGGYIDSCDIIINVFDTLFACCTAPSFSGGGNSLVLCPGADTAFVGTPSGAVDSLQWQVSTDSGSIWNNIFDVNLNYTGTQTDTLRIINTPVSFDNNLYHAIVFGCGGQQDTSIADTLRMDFIEPKAQCIKIFESLDQFQTNVDSFLAADDALAQSFQPGITGELTHAEFMLGHQSSSTVTVQLRTGNLPNSGTILATKTIGVDTSIALRDIQFEPPVAVTAGNDYIVTIDDGNDPGSVLGQYDAINTYTNGAMWVRSGVSWGFPAGPYDMVFNTYVALLSDNADTLYLNGGGNAAVSVTDIENGSSDNCGIDSTWILTTNYTCADTGQNDITMVVRDETGNVDSCTTRILVLDTLPPSITCPMNATAWNDSGNCAIAVPAIAPSSVADNCAADTTYTLAGVTSGAGAGDASGSVFNVGVTTVTYRSSDLGNLQDSCSFSVTVIDSIPPEISNCPANQVIPTDSANCSLPVSWAVPGAADNCGVMAFTSTHVPGDTFSVGVDTVWYIATDSSGNVDSCSFAVTVQSDSLGLNLTASQFNCGFNIACNGDSNAWVAAVVSGGCLPYTYLWNSGPTGDTLQNVGAGAHWVTVTDGLGNTLSDTIILTEPTPLTAVISGDSILCPGDSTASLSVAVNGGCPPYTYLWNSGLTTDTVSSLPAGTWWVDVTDANGCVVSDTFTIANFAAPVVSLGADTTICNGDSITLNAGTGFSSYAWSTGGSGPAITVSAAGSYFVDVTDTNGCGASDTMTLGNYVPVVVNIGPDTTICNGDSITLNAGLGFSSYAWSTGATGQAITVSTSGTYFVDVADANGCPASDTVIVDTASVPFPIISQPGGNDLCVSPTGTGYTWFLNGNPVTGAMDSCYTPTQSGNYSVTVIYPNGCSATSPNYLFTGRSDAIEYAIKVFPNPTEGRINILPVQAINEEVEIRVHNMLGQAIYFQKMDGLVNKVVLDLNAVSAGSYLLTVSSETGNFKKLILIER